MVTAVRSNHYDIIGDIHGHASLLRMLADTLGYDAQWRHPDGRRLVFVGDIADRGPENVEALRLVMRLVIEGRAFGVLGNHDDALLRWLNGSDIPLNGGIEATIRELESQPDAMALKVALRDFLSNTPLVLGLDGGKLIVVHAGIEDPMIGSPITPEMRRFILNGDAVGRSPEGKTLRRDWAADHRGLEFIVYGHTPQSEAVIVDNTINVDTGVYRTGRLSAVRWPERTVITIGPEETASTMTS